MALMNDSIQLMEKILDACGIDHTKRYIRSIKLEMDVDSIPVLTIQEYLSANDALDDFLKTTKFKIEEMYIDDPFPHYDPIGKE